MNEQCSACGFSPTNDLGETSEGKIRRCPQCRSLRIEVTAPIAENKPEEYGAAYDQGRDDTKSERVFDLLHQFLGENRVEYQSLLDVGCGTGSFLEIAQKDNWKVCGMDSDPSAVAALQSRGIAGIHGILGGECPPVGEAFDVVTLWDVIEHVADIEPAIAWLASSVRPGGLLFVLTPNADSRLDSFAHLERRLTGGKSDRLMNLCLNRYHLQRFTSQGLITAFQRHGFSVERHLAVQTLSLKPERYLSGFAPGIQGWTPWAAFNRIASQIAYGLLRASGIKNKILYVGRRVEDHETGLESTTPEKKSSTAWQRFRTKPTVVLVRPPTDRKRLFRCYSMFGSREAPMGLLYLASHLHDRGFSVKILDGERCSTEILLSKMTDWRPDIVGVTSTTFSFFDSAHLIKRIRAILPDARLIMGGPHVSALPQDSMERIPELDGCIVGEGEETLLEIAEGKAVEEIAGLAWRNEAGSIFLNANRHFVEDLDRYQLHWDLLPDYPVNYQPPMQSRLRNISASLVASRGCSYGCSFCAGSATHGGRRRSHSPSRVVDWMNELSERFQVDDFYFHDDHFTLDIAWLDEFCDRLLRLNKPLKWSCASRVDVLNAEKLEKMRRAGCWQIGVGVESGSESVLQHVLKQTDTQGLQEGIRRTQSAGIAVKAYVIIGTPHETFSDVIKTFRFLSRTRVEDVQVCFYTALPGSKASGYEMIAPQFWPRMNLLTPFKARLPAAMLHALEFALYAQTYGRKIFKLVRKNGSSKHNQPGKKR